MMTPSCSGAVGPNEEGRKNKLNDDLVVFMSKRSDHDAPRYTATLKNYVDLQQKRRRAANARLSHNGKRSAPKKLDPPENDGPINSTEHRGGDDERIHKRRGGEKLMQRQRSRSRSQSCEPVDACGRRRRRRRRRSCSRRRRSRRRRRSSCRRRRRSRSRRRRRRSCRRRRQRLRRCRRR